jgi:hypothetical protein
VRLGRASPLGEQRAHHQAQGGTVAAGGSPALQPLQQRRGPARLLAPLRRDLRRKAKTGEEGLRVIQARLPLPESVEQRIQSVPESLQLFKTELRQRFGSAPRPGYGTVKGGFGGQRPGPGGFPSMARFPPV